jgi:cytochrome c-type biogenesis protein CcmH
MSRLRSSLLVLALAAISLGQTASQLVTPEIRRVGDKLACLCGACKNTVATCQMLQCHYSYPARQRIAEMQAKGMSDQAIIDVFVKENGTRALAVPPAEGFNLLGWVMPFLAIGAGLAAIYMFIQKYRKPVPAAADSDPAVLDAYRERIESDLAKLD